MNHRNPLINIIEESAMIDVKKSSSSSNNKNIQNNFLYYSHKEHPILKLICKHENLQCERKLTRKKVYPLENMQCHSETLCGTRNRQRFLFHFFLILHYSQLPSRMYTT